MASAQALKLTAFEFPAGGLVKTAAVSGQPTGTTPDCLNVVPFDPLSGRGRGGQRAGVSVVSTFPGGSPSQLILQTDIAQTLVPAGGLGFTTSGADLDGTLTYPSLNTDSIFSTQEAGTPWIAKLDATNLGNAVFGIGTSITDPTGAGTHQISASHWNTGSPQGNFFKTIAGATAQSAKTFLAIKRRGSTAPVATWGPTYAASMTVNFDHDNDGCVAFLLAVADGSGGTSSGNLAAGIQFHADFNDPTHNQITLDFITVSGSAAPVVISSFNLVTQFNTLFPAAPGGPITLLDGDITFELYKQSASSGNDVYMLKVTNVVSGTPYTWYLGTVADPTVPYQYLGSTWGGVQDSICFGQYQTTSTADSGLVAFYFNGVKAAAPIAGTFTTINQLAQRAIHVTNGNIYVGTITSMTLATGGGGIFNASQLLSGDFGEGSAFIVDGTVTKAVDISNGVVSDLTATALKGTVPAGCRIAVVWNDRLLLSNQDTNEQNIFASRQGDYHDWLYGQPDAQSAWALNASGNFGHVGQAVFALMPITSDILVVGCSSSLYVMEGDPAYGGSLKLGSPSIGVTGQHAWTVDEKGNVYFVGSGGLWKLSPKLAAASQGENGMTNLSEGKYPQFFSDQNLANVNVFVCWDHDRRGVWVYMAPRDGTAGTHLFWDSRTEGFFPQQFAATKIGPTYATAYQGLNGAQRGILLGGNDGNLRIVDPAATSDDGSAISSRVLIGPKPLANLFEQRIVQGMEFWLASAPALPNLTWAMQVGDDAETSLAGSTIAGTGTFTAGGRQQKQLARGRGTFGTLKLTNATLNKGWAFEQVAVVTAYGGQNR